MSEKDPDSKDKKRNGDFFVENLNISKNRAIVKTFNIFYNLS